MCAEIYLCCFFINLIKFNHFPDSHSVINHGNDEGDIAGGHNDFLTKRKKNKKVKKSKSEGSLTKKKSDSLTCDLAIKAALKIKAQNKLMRKAEKDKLKCDSSSISLSFGGSSTSFHKGMNPEVTALVEKLQKHLKSTSVTVSSQPNVSPVKNKRVPKPAIVEHRKPRPSGLHTTYKEPKPEFPAKKFPKLPSPSVMVEYKKGKIQHNSIYTKEPILNPYHPMMKTKNTSKETNLSHAFSVHHPLYHKVKKVIKHNPLSPSTKDDCITNHPLIVKKKKLPLHDRSFGIMTGCASSIKSEADEMQLSLTNAIINAPSVEVSQSYTGTTIPEDEQCLFSGFEESQPYSPMDIGDNETVQLSSSQCNLVQLNTDQDLIHHNETVSFHTEQLKESAIDSTTQEIVDTDPSSEVRRKN